MLSDKVMYGWRLENNTEVRPECGDTLQEGEFEAIRGRSADEVRVYHTAAKRRSRALAEGVLDAAFLSSCVWRAWRLDVAGASGEWRWRSRLYSSALCRYTHVLRLWVKSEGGSSDDVA